MTTGYTAALTVPGLQVILSDPNRPAKFVWAAGPVSPLWMRGGSYLVARRIQIDLWSWDKTGIDTQEQAVGRHKVSGAELHLMPPFAHILLASPRLNGGQQILRRGYSYTTGIDPATNLQDRQGRPLGLVPDGEVLAELLG